jgi:hypothetical protein
MALKPCPQCGNECSTDAKTCPKCGARNPAKRGGCFGVVLAVVVLWMVIATLNGSGSGRPVVVTPVPVAPSAAPTAAELKAAEERESRRMALQARLKLDGKPWDDACIIIGRALRAKGLQDETKRFLEGFAAPHGYRQGDTVDVQAKKVFIGMSRCGALAAWGKPEDINRTVGKYRTREQWVYGTTYLYFDDNQMTSFQD